LQEIKTLYIGGAEPAVVRRAFVGYELAESRLGRFKTWQNEDRQNEDSAESRFGQIKTMRDCDGKFNDHDGSYRLGDGSVGNKHEVER
jgi:hypothetical protein